MPQIPKLRVLIVDDDKDICEVLGELLSESFEVSLATGGNAAWALVQTNDFDAVVSDMRMPEGNGLELLSRIRQNSKYAKMPVIMMSGFSDTSTESLLAAGANAVLPKPFDHKHLISLFNRYLS